MLRWLFLRLRQPFSMVHPLYCLTFFKELTPSKLKASFFSSSLEVLALLASVQLKFPRLLQNLMVPSAACSWSNNFYPSHLCFCVDSFVSLHRNWMKLLFNYLTIHRDKETWWITNYARWWGFRLQFRSNARISRASKNKRYSKNNWWCTICWENSCCRK